jgi:outer membrane protein assembly factor BamB
MKKLLLLLFCCSVTYGADWPQFRGPKGNGHAEGASYPTNWSETEHITWKTPVHGRAWSSPVIWGKQVWMTTATEDGQELFAICVDLDSGKIVRDQKLFHVDAPQFAHKFNTYGSPTPAIEEGRVYLTFGSPGTACLDTKMGKVLWERRDFVCNHYRGAGSSPIIYADKILMHFDGSDYQYVVALDKQTGKTIWKTDRSIDHKDLDAKGKPEAEGDYRKAFSTPVIANFGQGDLLISLGSKALYAYEPNTGKEIWRAEERKCHSGSATPVIGNGLIFAPMGFSKGEMLAVKPGGKGDVTSTHIAWKSSRNVPNKPSPLIVDGLLYTIDEAGVASCLEPESGKEIWRERVGGNYSAAPLYAGGKIYFFSEEGKTTVVAPGREFKILATSELGDGFMASPAALNGALVLRSRTHLYKVQ